MDDCTTPPAARTKTCTKCGKSLPATTEFFYQSKDAGLAARCKGCICADVRAYQAKHPRSEYDYGDACAFPKCNRKNYAHGYCQTHAKQLHASGDPSSLRHINRHPAWVYDMLRDQGLRLCSRCDTILPATTVYFYRQLSNKRPGLTSDCKGCREKRRQELLARPGQKQAQLKSAREGHRRRKYGLTRPQMEQLIAAQGGICPITGRKLDPKARGRTAPCIDHDHGTGAVRGVLSHQANVALGLLHDDPDAFRRAAAYLDGRLFD